MSIWVTLTIFWTISNIILANSQSLLLQHGEEVDSEYQRCCTDACCEFSCLERGALVVEKQKSGRLYDVEQCLCSCLWSSPRTVSIQTTTRH
ncbi:hypothetical protein M3Y98_01022300 [Aphelenchoides besseyi]|nr:hypothetical protein M3Y98_01022300 [Aphelenchoides besseyi]KAI6210059.1 hypothetical protein M3Y96_00287100 [Aphelenchoides besseyi]